MTCTACACVMVCVHACVPACPCACPRLGRYSRGTLDLQAVMSLLVPQQVQEMDPTGQNTLPYLPNRQYSSDHLPLAALFKFNDDTMGSMWQ